MHAPINSKHNPFSEDTFLLRELSSGPPTSLSPPILPSPQAAFNSLAEALNGAILRHQGLPAVSALERAFQQVSVVLDLLRAQNVPQATVIDLRQMALGDKSSGKV